ncbi:hypothetical protein [Streptomyces albidoflavus]|uniref:hypothetical protein n=1 Tax=Streptomyces albidoflavus TaxID=1886 RepID=UPI0010212D65|nr:hypothetical protein [Streptomyces albidoflavus]RZF02916.1 hypothetical protein C0R05_32410 [Streptomyces albidoflavus]
MPELFPVPQRSLPAQDDRFGEIRWSEWEPVPRILCAGRRGSLNLADGSCTHCRFPGPLLSSSGMVLHSPEGTSVSGGAGTGARRPSAPAAERPYWCHSHYAVSCPECGETSVYVHGPFAEDGQFSELRHCYVAPREEGTLF